MSGTPPTDPRRAEHEALSSVRSLRTLVLLCVLAPVLLFGIVATWRWQQAHAEAEVRIDRALSVAREHAQKVLEVDQAMLRQVVALAEANPGPARLHAQLKAIAAGQPQVQSLWVLDAAGRPVASDGFDRFDPAVDFRDRDFFQWHRSHPGDGSLYFSTVMVGKVTRTPFFSISQALPAADGGFGGVVSTSLTPEYFLRFYEALAANQEGLSIAMFRDDGSLYARWPEDGGGAIPARSPVLDRIRAGGTEFSIRAVSARDGRERLLYFRKVGSFPVYVGTSMELGAIRGAWARELGLLAALALVPLLGVLVAGLTAMQRARLSAEAARRLREEAEARVQVEEALRHSQKMEAMGRLTGGVAHDFNNALMVISANLHMLQMAHPAVRGRQTDAIARAVTTASNLTRQLLAFSRRQALLPQVVSLQDKLPRLRDMLSPVLGSQVELAIEVDPGTASIQVDVAELELAVINLAVNAKDAMPEGGRFRLVARNAPAPAPLVGEAVLVEATDSGCGIDPAVLARVFEPFFTTKPVGEGTGLGLSQVWGLCQRSGGTVEVRSTPGVGTTVAMLFPPSTQPVDEDTPADSAAAVGRDLRVVLVEDNAEVAAAIRPLLESLGCQVTLFTGARDAAGWIDAHPGAIDLVLTDVVMPGDMDGLDLARFVRGRHPTLGLVVMTGYAERLEAIDRLGFTVLAKPWTPANLARVLRAEAGARSTITA